MCRWMWSHFHDWIEYNGVAFSMELLEWQVFCEDKTNDTRLYPAIPRMREVFSHTSRERRKGQSVKVLRRSIPSPPKEKILLVPRVTRQ